jgi:CyaY protein
VGLTEVEFRNAADRSLETLNRSLSKVADSHDVEVLFQNGVLTVEVEEGSPGKIVVSPNAPVRQIWISAQSKSFKLDWDDARRDFVYASTAEALPDLLARLVDEQLEITR